MKVKMKTKIIISFSTAFLFMASPMAQTNWALLKPSVDSRSSKALNPNIKKRLDRAQRYLGDKDYKKTTDLLISTLNSAKSYPYDLASTHQALGYAYAQNENYGKARVAFKKAIELNVLPKAPTVQMLFSLAQLNGLAKDIDNALDLMTGYFVLNDKPSPAAHIFLATLFVEKKNQKRALEEVEKAIALDKNPKEQWLTFAVWLHYEKKNYKRAAQYLKLLASLNIKKKNYWSQLAGNLIHLNKEKEALAVMELAYTLNLLDQEGEILNIVSLFQSTGMSFQGAKLLEKSLNEKKVAAKVKNYRLLSQLYLSARENEKALVPLEKAAAIAKDGNLYADQGRVYLAQENWKKALDSYNLSFKKGKLKNIGDLHVEKAIALINLKRNHEAATQLNMAMNYEKSAPHAKKWIGYLQSL